MEKYFLGFSVKNFPRSLNKEADEFAKAAAQKNPLPLDVFFKTLRHGSIHSEEALAQFVNAITSKDWRMTIMAFL